MLRIYKTLDEKGLFKEIDKIEKGCWINLVDPSTQEINNIINAQHSEIAVVIAAPFRPR